MRLQLSAKTFSLFTVLLACPTIQAESTADLIASGDLCDQRLNPAEALRYYRPAEEMEPTNAALLVRMARQYRHLMAETAAPQEKIRLGKVALGYGQRAAALAPHDSDAQLSTAITYGKMLPFQGKKEQVEASPRIKAAAEKAIKLDPHNDLAWHVLGRWHQVCSNVSSIKRTVGQMIYGKLPASTNAQAVACFSKAIELNPRSLRHYIELGRTYAQMGETSAARRFISKGLAMPNVEKDDPELKVRGRETLAKIQ